MSHPTPTPDSTCICKATFSEHSEGNHYCPDGRKGKPRWSMNAFTPLLPTGKEPTQRFTKDGVLIVDAPLPPGYKIVKEVEVPEPTANEGKKILDSMSGSLDKLSKELLGEQETPPQPDPLKLLKRQLEESLKAGADLLREVATLKDEALLKDIMHKETVKMLQTKQSEVDQLKKDKEELTDAAGALLGWTSWIKKEECPEILSYDRLITLHNKLASLISEPQKVKDQ